MTDPYPYQYDPSRLFGDKRLMRLGLFIALFAIAAIVVYTTFEFIPPGHVGVLINRAGGGVQKVPLGVGFQFKTPVFQEIVEYPIFMQTLVLTRDAREGSPFNDEINVNSIEGQPISTDVSLSFEIDPLRVPSLYETFRTDLMLITHGFVKQAIRQGMQEVVGRTEIVNFLGKDKAEVVLKIQADIQQRLGSYGFLVKQFTLNEVRAPESIVKAIEAKNTMAQEALRAQNELQKREFEAQQKVAEAKGDSEATLMRAKAQAEANRILAVSLTPTLVEYRRIDKWNGALPQVTGGATPFLNLAK